jgi:enterochelin esterase family protein
MGQDYPRVHADRSVTFQLKAPDAQKVQVRLGKLYDMEKGADGVWTVTLPPQVVGFHYYYLFVDGVQVSDPASETFYGVGRQSSAIEIPEVGVDYYDVKDVPHGELRSRRYFSKVTGKWRRCFVYTPPGYDTHPKERYPVLYLMPGAGEDDRAWFTQGWADLILDNLIAAGKAKPMILVADNQFTALKPGEPPLVMGGRRGASAPGAPGGRCGISAITPKSRPPGAGPSSTHRPTTTRTSGRDTPYFTCNTAAARTNAGGQSRAEWTTSWTT